MIAPVITFNRPGFFTKTKVRKPTASFKPVYNGLYYSSSNNTRLIKACSAIPSARCSVYINQLESKQLKQMLKVPTNPKPILEGLDDLKSDGVSRLSTHIRTLEGLAMKQNFSRISQQPSPNGSSRPRSLVDELR